MRIDGRILKLEVSGVHVTAWLRMAEPVGFTIEILEPYRGATVTAGAYNSFFGAMAWDWGDRRGSLAHEDGTLTPLGVQRAMAGLRRFVKDAIWFEQHREPLSAACARIVARLDTRASKVHAIDAAELAAAMAALEVQRRMGLREPSYQRRLGVLEARHEAGGNVGAQWPVRLAQHVAAKYGRRISERQVRQLAALFGLPVPDGIVDRG